MCSGFTRSPASSRSTQPTASICWVARRHSPTAEVSSRRRHRRGCAQGCLCHNGPPRHHRSGSQPRRSTGSTARSLPLSRTARRCASRCARSPHSPAPTRGPCSRARGGHSPGTELPTWPEPDRRSAAAVARAYADGQAAMVTAEPFASAMRWYQRYLYLRGPMLAVILLIPPAVGLTISLRGRTFSLRGRSTEGRRAADPVAAALRRMSWLCWCSAAALLVIPPVTVDFDYRYVLPVVPFGCLAAALAVLRLAVFAGGTDAGQNPGRAGTSAAASMRTVHELTRSDS